MNKPPGQVTVTVETGYCPFCFRVRNLRHEARHMGTLVRTTIICESCHRTLSSTMGVAGQEPAAPVPAEGEGHEGGQPELAVEEPAGRPAVKADPTPAAKPAAAKGAAKPKARAPVTKAQAPKSRSQRGK